VDNGGEKEVALRFGITLIADETALLGLWFDWQPGYADDDSAVLGDSPTIDAAKRWLDEYFAGCIPRIEVPLRLEGTPFRKEAWAYRGALVRAPVIPCLLRPAFAPGGRGGPFWKAARTVLCQKPRIRRESQRRCNTKKGTRPDRQHSLFWRRPQRGNPRLRAWTLSQAVFRLRPPASNENFS